MNTLLLANNPGFYIGSLKIHYYALCIVTAMIMAAVFSALLMKRRNMAWDFIFTLFITCIPTAIVGARLFYCITKPLPIQDWYKIWEGGLSIIGGASSGVAMGLLVCKLKKVNFWRAADCVVPTILLAHLFGRVGNFFNGEIYGPEITDPNLQWFPLAVPINGGSGLSAFGDPNSKWYCAFFFYEGLICLIAFFAIFTILWFWKKKPNGLFVFSYFLIYGIMRTVMEPLRVSKDILSGNSGIPWSMVISVLYIVFAVVGITTLLALNYVKEGSVFGSKKGDPCGIREYLTPNKEDTPYFSKINMFGDQYPPKPPKEEREKITVKEWFARKKVAVKEWFVRVNEWFVKKKNWFVGLFKKDSETEAEETEIKEADETKEAETVETSEVPDTGDTEKKNNGEEKKEEKKEE